MKLKIHKQLMKCKHYALHFMNINAGIELTAYWTQPAARATYMMSGLPGAALLH